MTSISNGGGRPSSSYDRRRVSGETGRRSSSHKEAAPVSPPECGQPNSNNKNNSHMSTGSRHSTRIVILQPSRVPIYQSVQSLPYQSVQSLPYIQFHFFHQSATPRWSGIADTRRRLPSQIDRFRRRWNEQLGLRPSTVVFVLQRQSGQFLKRFFDVGSGFGRNLNVGQGRWRRSIVGTVRCRRGGSFLLLSAAPLQSAVGWDQSIVFLVGLVADHHEWKRWTVRQTERSTSSNSTNLIQKFRLPMRQML